MNRVRPIHVWLIALASPLLLSAGINPALAQTGLSSSGQNQMRGKPFVDIHAPMPKAVTTKKLPTTRASSTTVQTIDVTPNTPTVQDTKPMWSNDEQTVAFVSNRTDLAGTTAGTLTHIYTMRPDGSLVAAMTGPLASPNVGSTSSQTDPAFNDAKSLMVYVDTDDQGNTDLIEMRLNASPRTIRGLVSGNPNGLNFVELRHPRYAIFVGSGSGTGTGVVFAGRLAGQTNFHIYTVDTASGQIAALTSGIADDQAPSLTPDGRVFVFESNRTNADGSAVSAVRNVWCVGTNPTIPNAKQVTNFSAGGSQSSNIEPVISNNKADAGGYINGTILVAFASTRYDTLNNGNPDGVNPNGTHDIYWLKVAVDVDPLHSGVYTLVNPVNSALAVEDSGSNPAYKLSTSDPQHVYDDRDPAWPQFISTYRMIYDTDRSTHNPYGDPSVSQSGPANQPRDLFSSTLIDLNAPTLVRWNEGTGEVVNITPRLASPGQSVTISAKLYDLETGIRDVWVQVKNPNSKYQGMPQASSADGLEHKCYLFENLTPDGSNYVKNVPVEWESEPVDAQHPASPYGGRTAGTQAVAPAYVASFDDAAAFSGGSIPNVVTTKWLKLNFVSRDATTGVSTYSATWTTPTTPSDYLVDVIAFDNARNPFGAGSSNWQIFDNVWGFSTQPFTPSEGILFVSDYATGQKFFNARYGVGRAPNVNHAFWGTESWMTDIDVSLLPSRWTSMTTNDNNPLYDVLNTLGVKSYSTDLTGSGGVSDGVTRDGYDAPKCQRYDIWRIQCRGAVPDSVLRSYLPGGTVSQPADVLSGETDPRTVLVSRACVIWHAPYTGDVFAGPGTLTDMSVQAQLAAFVAAGGRLWVNGQDIGWALTLDGAVTGNSFLSDTLKATYVRDLPDSWPHSGSYVYRMFGVLFPNWNWSASYQIPNGPGAFDPVVDDPWHTSGNPTPGADHGYRWDINGVDLAPDAETNYLAGAYGTTTATMRTYGCPGAAYPDVFTAGTDAQLDLTFGGLTTNPIIMHYPTATKELSLGPRVEAMSGQRVVFTPFGFEGLNPILYDLPNPPFPSSSKALRDKRASIAHNISCWMHTATIQVYVRSVEGGQPISGALVRLASRVTSSGRASYTYTGVTDASGRAIIEGVRPDRYTITAAKSGMWIQRQTGLAIHGFMTESAAVQLTTAQNASVRGRVTLADGSTPVSGAVVRIVDALDGTKTFTATSDSDGNYVLGSVPPGTTYTMTCTATGYGTSVPANYTVPNPNDPVVAQRDELVQPQKSYVGFDFTMPQANGGATGHVYVTGTTTPIVGATVTATKGTSTVTAVTDANGAYTFGDPSNGLAPGTWTLVASAPGYASNTGLSISVVSNAVTSTGTDIYLSTLAPGSLSGLVTRTSDGSGLSGVTVSVVDSNGNAVSGVDPVTTTDVQTDGTGYRYNFKFSTVPAGATYRVSATKSGYRPKTGTTFPQQATVAASTETKNVNFQLDAMATFTGAMSMVSAPFTYTGTDVGQLLDIPTADRTYPTFGFLTWRPSALRYVIYNTANNDEAKTFIPGRGYFLAYSHNMGLATEGTAISRTTPFTVSLNTGWNMVGNPFSPDGSGNGIDIDWTKVSVQVGTTTLPYDQAVAQGVISSALYTYTLGTYALDYQIETWKGYWVRAYQSCSLVLDPVNAQASRAARSVVLSRAVLRGSNGWTVNLQATAGSVKDEANYIGVSGRAAEGFDSYKVAKPPVIGDKYVYMAIKHDDWGDKSDGYGVDIRSSATGTKKWDFTVQSNVDAGPVTLTWPNAAGASRNVVLTLTDLSTGVVRNMRTSSGYTWQSTGKAETRSFRIEATVAGRGDTLRISGLATRQSGRSGAVAINYNLSMAADVEVRILGAGGRTVRTVTTRASRAAGLDQVTWDGRNDKGVSLPAGMYQVEVHAQTADGKQVVRQISPVIVTR